MPSIRSAASAAVAAAVLVVLPACSGGDDGDIVYSTTTLDPSATTLPLGAPPARPISLGEFTTLLDDAVAAGDPCGLMEIIDFQRPDVSDPDDAIDAYKALADATSAAKAFVPAELRSAWGTIVEVTQAASASLAVAGGDVTDPSVGAHFDTSTFDAAYETTAAWVDLNCG